MCAGAERRCSGLIMISTASPLRRPMPLIEYSSVVSSDDIPRALLGSFRIQSGCFGSRHDPLGSLWATFWNARVIGAWWLVANQLAF